jgi:apolipoprotein N-acyltransferase
MLPRFINAEALSLDLDKIKGDDLLGLAAVTWLGPEVWQAGLNEAVLRNFLKGKLQDKPSEPPKDYWVLEPRARLSNRCYAEDVARLSRDLQCPVLAGGSTLHRNCSPVDKDDLWLVANSTLVFDRGELAIFEYDKIHLVPFSEYVPFKRSWPWAYRLLRLPVPDVMAQLEPGTRLDVYELKRGAKSWRLAAPICYEGVFDRLCRRMVAREGGKDADVLVNLSNDGWFVWPFWRRGGSNEHSQHLAQYCFRAVENRVPVVRAVNTGISASIDSCGRLVAVVQQYGRREMVAGTMLLKDDPGTGGDFITGRQILVDRRRSVYSLVGDAFAMAVSVGAVAVCALLLVPTRRFTQTKGQA